MNKEINTKIFLCSENCNVFLINTKCEINVKNKFIRCKINIFRKKPLFCRIKIHQINKVNFTFPLINYFNVRKRYFKDNHLSYIDGMNYIDKMSKKEIDNIKILFSNPPEFYKFRGYFWNDKSKKRNELINLIKNSEEIWKEQ